MNEFETMNFDITLKEVPVTLNNAGKREHYCLREATGEAACKWQNKIFASAKIGADGKPTSIGNVADIEPYLLSLCLFPYKPDGSGTADKPVTESVIRSWPSNVTSALYDKCLTISGLKKKEDKQTLLTTIEKAQQSLALLESSEDDSPKN